MRMTPPPLDYYRRMVTGLHQYLGTPLPADLGALLREQLERREECFLDSVGRTIFANSDNPYHRMLCWAGCSYEDLAESVRRDGIESALCRLHREGVRLSHDEFKGKVPIRRAWGEMPGGPLRFRNPFAGGGLESRSSGSRSGSTGTSRSPRHRFHHLAYQSLCIREFDLGRRCRIQVKYVLPASDGISGCISYAYLGLPVDRWFAPGAASADSAHYRLATNLLVAMAGLRGVKVPFPSHLPPNDFTPVAEWIARRRREGSSCVVGAHVSPAVRIASAAVQGGFDIRGTLFLSGGEALTAAKQQAIEASGCEVFPRYHISEIGPIGYGCRRMSSGNCVHLFHDSVAVIPHRRPAPFADTEVESLLFTTLLPSAPYVLINAEMDDSGVIEAARCDCVFSAAGFRTAIRGIFSFGKLTGQGVTLVGTDIVQLLEEMLPRSFGGSPTDYQLAERETGTQTGLVLRVSPRAGRPSPEEVKNRFLAEIRRFEGGASASRIWKSTEALEVVIAEPISTSTGKVLPLHLLGSNGGSVA